jgi:branched-subunit amino acid aminotransferase/4-amino-4-deoxychorismate lyase
MSAAATEFAPWFGVFETLRVIKGRPLFVPEHVSELGHAMAALGLETNFNFDAAIAALPPKSGRLRWIVRPDDTQALFTEEDDPSPDPVALSVSPVRVGSQNWDARFKTLSYLSHAQAGQTASTPEALLLNEQGHIASAARGNIFWRRGDRICTPVHEAGCRCGVVRRFVLDRIKVEQGHFPLQDLLDADEIFVTGSMKGIISVNALEKRTFTAFALADTLRPQYAAAIQTQLR